LDLVCELDCVPFVVVAAATTQRMVYSRPTPLSSMHDPNLERKEQGAMVELKDKNPNKDLAGRVRETYGRPSTHWNGSMVKAIIDLSH
jgi:hypothetical protein